MNNGTRLPENLTSKFLKVELILLAGMLLESYGYFFDKGVALYVGLVVILVGLVIAVIFVFTSKRSIGIAGGRSAT